MNAKELKEIIKDVPDEAEIILQKDGEGNSYSPLCQVDVDAVYVPENTHSGDVYRMDWYADDAGMSEEEWEEMKQRPRCVVLEPVN